MKKTISLLLISLLCMLFCGCGQDNTEAINNELEALWAAQIPMTANIVFVYGYAFDDGDAMGQVEALYTDRSGEATLISRMYGEYEITDDKIIIDWTEKEIAIEELSFVVPSDELSYQYDDGTLQLFAPSPLEDEEKMELYCAGKFVE